MPDYKNDLRADKNREQPEEELVSKMELKRKMQALQDIGEALVNLPDKDLQKIPIADENLADAIHLARKITANSGKRRQLQYIGKLMRKIDPQPIQQALAELQGGLKEQARQFHQLEALRDQLLEQGVKSIETVVERYPNADRQNLRQLVLQANRETKLNKPPAASRKLFKYLRALEEE